MFQLDILKIGCWMYSFRRWDFESSGPQIHRTLTIDEATPGGFLSHGVLRIPTMLVADFP